jgi:imidazolonepropionase-like amidohydrolase
MLEGYPYRFPTPCASRVGLPFPVTVAAMGATRVVLRSPGGEVVRRDLAEGLWGAPDGAAESTIGEGMWALPGLVDAHTHLARERLDYLPGDPAGARDRARQALESGVGLLLDKGWADLAVVEMMDAVSENERPMIEAAGRVYATEGGYWPGFARIVAEGQLPAMINEAVAEGRGWVKLMGDWPRRGIGPQPNFTEDELEQAVRIATEGGSRVAVHTMARETPSMAVRAGVHSVEHGLFLTGADLAALGARGGIWVPTAVQVETVITQLGAESSGGRLLRDGMANVERLLGLAVEAGVFVLTGTDLAIGAHQVALEAIRLWELGMPAGDVVNAVSRSGYQATGRSVDFDIGSPASAVLFDEDPVANPRILAHPAAIFWHGNRVR